MTMGETLPNLPPGEREVEYSSDTMTPWGSRKTLLKYKGKTEPKDVVVPVGDTPEGDVVE